MAEVQVRRFSSAEEVLKECREWLRQDEVSNALVLAVMQRLADLGSGGYAGCFFAEAKLGVVRLALACQAPGKPLMLASPALPEALGPLAKEWVSTLGQNPALAALRVVGEPINARAFAEKALSFLPNVHSIQSIHEMQILQILQAPALKAPVGGTSRLANDDELPLLSRWGMGFAKDAGLTDTQEQVSTRFSLALQRGELFVWEDIGELRSMCVLSQTGTGSARISAVYTPPAERGQGYGSAIVAEAARKAFAEGAKQVSLYVEKPEVRRLYERTGFTLVGEATEFQIVSG
jgi:GNAT superfamily N-acetyltransferase